MYRFGSYIVDPARREFSEAGQLRRIEPRAFDVLVYLIEHRDRAVSRDELIEQVWDRRVVSDGALSQAMAKLRRLLGTNAGDYLKTVHGTGYRFSGELLATNASTQSLAGKRRATTTLALVITLFGVALIAAFISQRTAQPTPGITRIGVAPIALSVNDATVSGELIAEALRVRLMDIGTVSVRELGYTAANYNSQDPVGSGEQMQIDWLFTGDLERVPGSPSDRLTMGLYDIHSARRYHLGVYSLPRLDRAQDTSQLIDLRDRIVSYALTRLPEHLVLGSPSLDLPDQTADYETYSNAQQRLDEEACDPSIVKALEPVVARNPRFGLALMALSYAHYNRFWACGGAPDALEQAIAAADALLAIDANYVEAINAKALALTSAGRVQQARTVVGEALARSPNSPILLAIQSNVLPYLGDLSGAVQSI